MNSCLSASADARTAQYGSEVSADLLQTVSGMHKKGIAWRDIKPSNLICTGNCPAALQLKAVDFAEAVRIPPGKFSLMSEPAAALVNFYMSNSLLICRAALHRSTADLYSQRGPKKETESICMLSVG